MVQRKGDPLPLETMETGIYQIEKTVEFSTFSMLFEGKNRNTGKAVLVRRWFPASVTTAQDQARIHEEVAAFQAVQYPGLLPLLEVSTTRESVFLVSMAVPGGTLGMHLGQAFPEPLPLAEAQSIITQVGRALAALHHHGLCHGHLTPHAIFFSEPDLVFLGEFRLPSVLACLPTYQPVLEEGMPWCWYMAPEQFSGAFDAATDQYALGCLAYHLLTGRVPFSGSARATLFQKHVHDQPRALRELNPALPAHIEEAVLKALAKQATERHASMQAFLEALDLPSRGTIAEQDTAENLVLPLLAAAPAQSMSVPATLQPGRVQAAVTGIFHRIITSAPATSIARPLTGGASHLRQSRAQVSVARIFHTITKSAPAISLSRVLANERRQLSSSPRRREFAVLALAIILVLILVLTAGGWLLASSHHALRQATKGTLSAVSTATSAPTQSKTQVPALSSPTPEMSPTPQVSATSAVPAITPFVDCVTQTGSSLQAEFGYQNPQTVTVTIPQGSTNEISPSNADGVQPMSFAPGIHHQVFHVRFFKHGTVAWTLNGMAATASSSSPPC